MSGLPTHSTATLAATSHVSLYHGDTYHGDANDLHLPELPSDEGGTAFPNDKIEHKVTVKEKDGDDDDDNSWELDPLHPRNWLSSKKWTATVLVSLYTFVAPLGSSMMAPGLLDVGIKYDITNPTILALTLSIFLLTFAIGPLFMAPLSEMYGRVWVLHLSNIFFLGFNIGCALAPTTVSFIIFRLLAGFAGSAPIAVGGGVVADLFAERERASAMAMYNLGPLMGPCVGPIMGGFIAETIGVQCVFYVIAGLCGVAALLALPLLRETYAPILELRHAKDPEKAKAEHPAFTMGKWAYLWINLERPVILLTRSFVCFVLSLYMALMYGIYYLMFATFPTLFEEVYHFNTGMSGLAYIGIGIGFVAAMGIGAGVSNKMYIALATKNGGIGKPEMRIPALIFGSFFVPVGLLWYGWSAEEHVQFVMPIIGTAIFGFGLMTTFLAIQLYLVDTFTYAASAVAAAAVFRSLLGFAFPLFGEQMFAKLGYGGGNSLLAGLAIVLGIPFPIWIYYAGEGIRARSSLSR